VPNRTSVAGSGTAAGALGEKLKVMSRAS
jgi:hypothetical protein